MNFNYTPLSSYGSIPSKCSLRILALAILMLCPLIHYSQTNELARHYVDSDMSLQSSPNRDENNPEIVVQEISEQGATWLRLFFENVNLGSSSTVKITSHLDGASQTLNSATIKQWNNSSAYFNGNRVTITLYAAPDDGQVGLNISYLSVGEPEIINDSRSQCGNVDNRVDSDDDAIGRIVPIGCTGWIITNGKLVTAGHCVGNRAEVIEFNVPKSNPDRSIVHPGPEDQYPIGNFISPYPNNQTPANDWGVFTASTNVQTGLTPIQAQGKSFNVVQSAPGNNITITGFGTDTGIDNQTQQTHTGPLFSVDNTFVRYRTDTTGGNSGSPIIDTATGDAVGVHAYGGCTASGGSNFGERATIPAFWDAMGLDDAPPTSCTGGINSFPYNQSYEGSLGQWSQSNEDDINWTINSNGTPSNGTGPSGAIDGNSYIYVEASGNGVGYPNKQAILNSPCLNFSGLSQPSIRFQYHMRGNSVGRLRVQARTNNTGSWVNIFNLLGAQGSGWNEANLDLSTYAGENDVQLRLNVVTGSSWQGDISIDAITIEDQASVCPSIDFGDFTINSFANQDAAGDFSIAGGGSGISMQNNTWKYIDYDYIVTANTVIEFDFSSSAQGEIHGVGFENDNSLTSSRYFKVHGTQNYGVTNFDNYTNGTITYVIPVGSFYTGNMDRLVFINDNDGGSGNTSLFSNVRVYEGSCGESEAVDTDLAELIVPVLGNEDEEENFFEARIVPNPATSVFTIEVKGNIDPGEEIVAIVYDVSGNEKGEIQLTKGANVSYIDNLSLTAGIYFVKIRRGNDIFTKKLFVK